MVSRANPPDYSIAAVSKLTGVSCHALRVWERRYGFPLPRRTSSNQRRYGPDQVQSLLRIADLARAGRPIGELVADHKAGRLGAGADACSPPLGSGPGPTSSLVDALVACDVGRADVLLGDLSGRLPAADLLSGVLEPALVEVGERWFRGEVAVYQEHFATMMILRSLGRVLDDARRGNPRPVGRAIVAAVQGDRHEGGVLILGAMLELSGWRALTLGVDIPVAELIAAVDAWKPDALGVSFVLSRNINKRFRELSSIRGLPVFVGGRSLLNHRTLARRHGLIPLNGPIRATIPQWIAEVARRRADPRRN